jgi:branched-chain amino acid transport system ATP-binding protein
MSIPSGNPILETSGLRKGFGGVSAVDGIRLRIGRGELRCIIGPNGAGKSTLFQLLLGRVRPEAGSIVFDGRDITRLHPFQRAHLGIAMKFQNLAVYQNLTVTHNLCVPLQHVANERTLPGEIAQLLKRLNLEGTEQSLVRNLPHGKKQWLAIGMALAMKPRLLLLDEPTAGMSPEETRVTSEIVRSLNAGGVTVLVIEHDMAFVRQLNSPVTVMHNGRIFAEADFAVIENDPDVRRLYLGSGYTANQVSAA